MNIIAIDPGKSGGIASIVTQYEMRGDDDAICANPMPPTIHDLSVDLDPIGFTKQTVAYVEHVQSFKGMPGFAMFGLGQNFGAILGILAAHNVRTVLVRPQKWQKFFGLGTRSACHSDNEWKNKLKAEAQRRFPKLNVTLKTADALLLLEYALHHERARN